MCALLSKGCVYTYIHILHTYINMYINYSLPIALCLLPTACCLSCAIGTISHIYISNAHNVLTNLGHRFGHQTGLDES